MKICIVDYDINPPWVEGVRNLAYLLSRQLTKRGHIVHIITAGSQGCAEEEVDGILFHRINRKPFSLYVPRAVKTLDEQAEFDLIQFQNAIVQRSFIPALVSIRRHTRKPTIGYVCLQPRLPIRAWRYIFEKNPFEAMKTDYLLGMFTPKVFIRQEFNLVCKIAATSNYLKEQVVSLGVESNRVLVIRPFVELSRFRGLLNISSLRRKFGFEENVPLILYIGSLKALRLAEFLKTISLVSKVIPSVRTVMVSPPLESVLSKIIGLGLQDNFIQLPSSKRIDVAELMAASDVYVYPGFSGTASIDPPLTIIEAIACGTPVVASNNGGISEVIEKRENCFAADPLDCRNMASLILKVLERGRGRRGVTGLQGSEFDSEVATERFISEYETLIRK